MFKNSIVIHKQDNVIVALQDLSAGTVVTGPGSDFPLKEDISRGHKIAADALKVNQPVVKYGLPIGQATTDIAQGEWVHTHNMTTALGGAQEYSYHPEFPELSVTSPSRQINAYHRANGEIAIRNELWVIPTVGCVNAVIQRIVERFIKEINPTDIDGVFAFPHPYGCSQMGKDHETTRTILQNMVQHPNAGGVLVVGLGCENNQITPFRDGLGEYDECRVDFMIAQEESDEIEAGVERLKAIYEVMRKDQRAPACIGRLKVGLECGGSDGLSGITANPLLGLFSDYLISHGGASVLTEVPEMFGAETLLMNRCRDEAVYKKTVAMINGFNSTLKFFFDRKVMYLNLALVSLLSLWLHGFAKPSSWQQEAS